MASAAAAPSESLQGRSVSWRRLRRVGSVLLLTVAGGTGSGVVAQGTPDAGKRVVEFSIGCETGASPAVIGEARGGGWAGIALSLSCLGVAGPIRLQAGACPEASDGVRWSLVRTESEGFPLDEQGNPLSPVFLAGSVATANVGFRSWTGLDVTITPCQ